MIFSSFSDKANEAINTCAIYFKTGVSFEDPNTAASANPTPRVSRDHRAIYKSLASMHILM